MGKKKKKKKGKLGAIIAHPMVRDILDELIAAALIAAAARLANSGAMAKTARTIRKTAGAAVGAKPKPKAKASKS